MLLKFTKPSDARESEVTPRNVYLGRRRFLRAAAAAGAGIAAGPFLAPGRASAGVKIPGVVKGPYQTDEEQTAFEAATKYNNFYEYGTGKGDPAKYSGDFKPKPWSVVVDGAVGKPGTYDFEDLVRPHALEERVYRLRCVEAWSMVIPWIGIPLADVIKRVEPLSGAKYVAFETVVRPAEMPGQRRAFLEWPYREGLRLDEAMNPLSLLAVGMYGEELPAQNGAPIRLVVPWKYGFKSIKSIVRMSFVGDMPKTTWNMQAAREYGFYSNVNPTVDHPRWSQARERRIGKEFGGISALFTPKRDTLMFNGYGEEVAHLYAGMDLAKSY